MMEKNTVYMIRPTQLIVFAPANTPRALARQSIFLSISHYNVHYNYNYIQSKSEREGRTRAFRVC